MKKKTKKYLLMIVLVIAVAAGILISALLTNHATSISKPEAKVKIKKNKYISNSLEVKIKDNKFTLDKKNGGAKFNIDTLNTQFPTTIELSKTTGLNIKINKRKIDSHNAYHIKFKELNATTEIKISVRYGGQKNYTDYFIRTLPDDFPKYSTSGQSAYPGEYYLSSFGTQKTHYIYKINNKGSVTFYKKVDGTPYDFKKTEIGSKTLYSYLEADLKSKYRLSSIGYAPTNAIVMDEHYKEIDRVTLHKYGDIPEGHSCENHDFKILGDRHYVVDAYVAYVAKNVPKELDPLPGGNKVINYVFQEIKDGKVLFQWESVKHPELYNLSVEESVYKNTSGTWADYAHFNSITVDPKDNNFVCSYRNLDTILKIDRSTGKILWKLGGKEDEFGLTKEQKFSRQHNCSILKDGTYTLFDNGNANKQTRILRFTIDEKDKKIKTFKAFEVTGRFSPYMGSAQILDYDKNVFLICWGGGYGFTNLPTVSEIDFSTNKSIFEFYYKDNPGLYRAYKYE